MFARRARSSADAVRTAGGPIGAVAALSIALAACAAAQAVPQGASPGSPSDPAPTTAGPTLFAAWTERQGFGGSSGLRNVAKLAHWIQNNPGEVTPADVASDTGDIASLTAWLDTHPATACWTAYHEAVRASLAALNTGYATAKVSIDAGRFIPSDVVTTMVAEADNAATMATPPNCP